MKRVILVDKFAQKPLKEAYQCLTKRESLSSIPAVSAQGNELERQVWLGLVVRSGAAGVSNPLLRNEFGLPVQGDR